MVYPTDEDPQDKVLVKAFNDRLKEQKHGKNMSDRIASRNRGTLPKTIYDFINQIVGEVTTLQHHQGNAAQWNDEGRERHRGGYDNKGRGDRQDRHGEHSSRPDQGRKGKPHVECNGCGGQGHTWKECRNYKHELFNPKEHVPYHTTSLAAEAERRYGKKRILLRFDGPKPLVTSVARFGRPHPPDTRAKSEARYNALPERSIHGSSSRAGSRDKGGDRRGRERERSQESRSQDRSGRGVSSDRTKSPSRERSVRSASFEPEDKRQRRCKSPMPSIVMATTCVKLCSGIPTALVKDAIVTHNIADHVTSSKKDILVPASIYHPMLPSHSPLFITVLLDTGAMTDDYVNLPTALWLANAGVKRSLCGDQVCSGLGNVNQLCVKCEGKYTFESVIYNDLTRGDQKLTVTAKAVPSAHYSLILGLKTIKKFNLSLTCFTYFTNLTTGRSL